MSEVVRDFPVTKKHAKIVRALQDRARMSVAYAEQAKKREKLVGQNTLRFVVQHVVHNETGLKHWFDFNQYTALDQLLISKRLGA